LLQCLGKEFDCPLKCSDSLYFSDSTKITQHLEVACPGMQLQCNICEETESRANLSSHDWCPIELKRTLVGLESQKAAETDDMTRTLALRNDQVAELTKKSTKLEAEKQSKEL